MRKQTFGAAFLALLLLAGSAAGQLVDPRGSETTFDMATWNLEQFPLAMQTPNVVATMISDLEIDLYGFQEIQDAESFNTMASNAGGYDAVYSAEQDGYNRFGVIYNTGKVTLGNSWDISDNRFIRDPMAVPVEMVENGDTLAFTFVVLHLKAFDSGQDIRVQEIAALKEYLDDRLSAGDTRWVVAGDWNDQLEDPDAENIFTPFLDDEDYTFLTLPQAGSGYYASWIGSSNPAYQSLIDHIMVTADVLADYGEAGSTTTMRLDDEYDLYTERVSDHRPVGSFFPAGTSDIAPGGEALPEGLALKVWPVPSNALVHLGWELPARGEARLSVVNLAGRTVLERSLEGGAGRTVWQAGESPSGLYLVRLATPRGSVVRRAVLVK